MSDNENEREDRHDPLRPAHTRKYAQFSDEWYRANQIAFVTAMQDEIRRNHEKQMKEAS
jgi:hypothetical protein